MTTQDGTMSNTDVPTLTTSIPKDFPETVKTFADVLKTLGVQNLTIDQEWQDFAVSSTQKLLDRYGKDWVWQHRVRLKEELELLDSM